MLEPLPIFVHTSLGRNLSVNFFCNCTCISRLTVMYRP